jgi:hypothetical protein
MMTRSWTIWDGRSKGTWEREFKLPWRGAGLLKSSKIVSMMKWIRTGRLLIKSSLLDDVRTEHETSSLRDDVEANALYWDEPC